MNVNMQVLDLLDAMELNQYKEVFSRERISGDVLLELGQDDLKEELGIHSKLHRYWLLHSHNHDS